MTFIKKALLGLCFMVTCLAAPYKPARTANTFHFTAPASGATVSSPVFIGLISGGAIPTSVTLWQDGTQVAQVLNTSSYSISLPMSSGSHYLKAEAVYSGGSQLWADTTFTAAAAAGPTEPANFTATPNSTTQVTLAWTASADSAGVTGYYVYRNNTLLATTATTGYVDTTAAANTAYTYAVAAYDAAGNISAQASASVTTTGPLSVAQQIYNDMSGTDEGYPHGVPVSYDFQPSIGEGNNISPNTAIEWWGALYVGPNGNPAVNTQLAVQNVQVWILSKSTGKWSNVLAPTSSFQGGYYSEDFSTDYGTTVEPMTALSNGSTAIMTYSGEVAHIYTPYPRITVNNTDIGGIVCLAEAQLVLINPNGVDDRSIASFLFDVGADPYPAATGAGIENSPNIGMGKFKYVQSSWRSFAMTTMTLAQLQNNPPPINLTGILP